MYSYYQNFAREIAARQGKQINLNSDSLKDVRIPQHLNKAVKEISIQLLRNAIVHGVESPSVRMGLGKPAAGNTDLTMQNNGKEFVITIQDDGQGIDYDKIRDRLVTLGRYSIDEARELERGELLNALFSSGFSTKESADEDGGRGVGLDIIKAQVKEYDGTLNVNSELGKMTRFVITLPNA